MLHILVHYGIRRVALDWFKNYLSNRIQVVKYNSAKSVSLEIKCGVPQGSALVKYTKFIGLLIDEELSWKYHINHVAMKISKLTGIIAKARHYLPLKTLQNIYYTMIYPYLIYCNAVWTNTYPTRLRPIYMIQNKIAYYSRQSL